MPKREIVQYLIENIEDIAEELAELPAVKKYIEEELETNEKAYRKAKSLNSSKAHGKKNRRWESEKAL